MPDKIYDFPTCPIQDQLFHVPGSSVEGGFTTGGSRITSPEPGGRSVLELQIAWQVAEWDFPIASWLMSKTNGQIFRVRLAPTPQVLSAPGLGPVPQTGSPQPVPWDNGTLWSNQAEWSGDYGGNFYSAALEGSTVVEIDMSQIPRTLQPGHCIGHFDNCYMCDEVIYDANSIATITVTPPLRRNIAAGDSVFFRPYFIGTISNGASFRSPYKSGDAGNIQPGNIIFNESICNV